MFGRHVSIPQHVRSALEAVLGETIEHVRVVEHSWFARLHLRMIATTRRRRIYLRGSAASFFNNSEFLLHEFCHVVKQWEPRRLTTFGYVLEWLRRGYWDNRFEIEAREFAADTRHRFQALLSQHQGGSPPLHYPRIDSRS